MKIKIVAVGVALMAISAVPAFAAESSTSTQTPSTEVSNAVTDALQQQAIQQRILDVAAAPIKSKVDLTHYLQAVNLQDSPLKYLSQAGRARFLNSLVFNANGLSSYRYLDLQDELTPTQIYKVLSLFGVQSGTPTIKGARIETDLDRSIMSPTPMLLPDHNGYACDGLHTCYVNYSTICTSNC